MYNFYVLNIMPRIASKILTKISLRNGMVDHDTIYGSIFCRDRRAFKKTALRHTHISLLENISTFR